MLAAISTECLASRVDRYRRHRELGQWASCHAILSGLRRCAERQGCANGDACASTVETLRLDLQGLLGGAGGTCLGPT